MKKFSFSLETVLNYKDQVLDNLRNEHAAILLEIIKQELIIEGLVQQGKRCMLEFDKAKTSGVSVSRMGMYENYLTNLSERIRREEEILGVIKRKEEVKKQQVIEAKTETASIEKLKEKKIEQYQKESQKEDERFIEEFVSNTRVSYGKINKIR